MWRRICRNPHRLVKKMVSDPNISTKGIRRIFETQEEFTIFSKRPIFLTEKKSIQGSRKWHLASYRSLRSAHKKFLFIDEPFRRESTLVLSKQNDKILPPDIETSSKKVRHTLSPWKGTSRFYQPELKESQMAITN